MSSPGSKKVVFYTLSYLLLLCAVLFFYQLNGYSLLNITEARQAEIARQILVRQDWLTPVYNGEVYFDKPILLHWLIALGFQIWGENIWAVRLPSAIAATLLVFVTYLFTRQFHCQGIALIAATSLAANPFSFTLGRTGQHDMLLTLFLSAALFTWYSAYTSGRRSTYLLFFGLLGLATLSKGPIALVLSVLIISTFLVLVRQVRQQWLRLPWGWGLTLLAAIVLPWYLAMIWHYHWEFVNQAFLFHNVSRFVSPNLNQTGAWWYYLPIIGLGLFAWLPPVPLGLMSLLAIPVKRLVQGGMRRSDHPTSGLSDSAQLHLFLLVWVIVIVGFMSLASTKLPWYVYPSVPPLLVLCAIAWNQQLHAPTRWLKLGLSLLLTAYLALAIGFSLVPHLLTDPLLNQAVQQTGAIQIGIGISAIATLVLATCLGSDWLSRTRRLTPITVPITAMMTNVIVFGLLAAMVVNVLLPGLDRTAMGGRLIAIAQVLHQTYDFHAGDRAVAIGVVEPSLNFYSKVDQIYRVEDYVKPNQLNLCLPQFALGDLPRQIQSAVGRSPRIFLITNSCITQVADFRDRSLAPVYQANGFQLFILQGKETLSNLLSGQLG